MASCGAIREGALSPCCPAAEEGKRHKPGCTYCWQCAVFTCEAHPLLEHGLLKVQTSQSPPLARRPCDPWCPSHESAETRSSEAGTTIPEVSDGRSDGSVKFCVLPVFMCT